MAPGHAHPFFSALLIAVLLLFAGIPSSGGQTTTPIAAARPERPTVTCTACLVLDDTGRVLFGRKIHHSLPNASTTKMVTALLVMRDAQLDDVVTVSGEAAGVGEGGLDLAAGESYIVEDLLHALLMSSSNDAAVALAEHVSGSEDAFVTEMNSFVTGLGLEDTSFQTAHGLDTPGHHASASDLAAIGGELLQDATLARIVATDGYSITPVGTEREIPVDNRNLLIGTYQGAIGIKTGFTDDAGNVLVAAAVYRGRTLISVVMHSEDSFEDSEELLDFGFARLARGILVKAGTPVAGLVYDPAGAVSVLATDTVRDLYRPEDVEILFEPEEDVRLPLNAGETIGTIKVLGAGLLLAEMPAVTATTVEASSSSPAGSMMSGVLSFVASLFGRG
ncbi:MAG TPA: D-alanyl-D-alanine carboxypeptidase family protein [Actinomycetota bacterium]|nr:D-alanyl-D-alanine carboxypeptidase family protein [Actinomycetota bacterium]